MWKYKTCQKVRKGRIWREKATIRLTLRFETDFGIIRLENYNKYDKYVNIYSGKSSEHVGADG